MKSSTALRALIRALGMSPSGGCVGSPFTTSLNERADRYASMETASREGPDAKQRSARGETGKHEGN